MSKKLPAGGFRVVLSVLGIGLLIGVALSFSEQASSKQADAGSSISSNNWLGLLWTKVKPTDDGSYLFDKAEGKKPDGETGTLEKMIAASGNVTMDVDLDLLNGVKSRSRTNTLRFTVVPNSFFTILVFDGELRGPLPSSMELVPQNTAALPAKLRAAFKQVVVESTPWGESHELVVRDAKTGHVVFNVEGHEYKYDADGRSLNVQAGRLLMSEALAVANGRPSDAGTVVGKISISATMRPIEISQVVNGDVASNTLPAINSPEAGTVPGPDVIVGDLNGLAQFGASSGTQVGLAVGTDSCNFGVVDLNWFANPANDHPVIPQNLYRMSGGAANDERFEQIGQSSVKHAFTALTQNLCSLGCNGIGGTRLGSGCSDPYSASLNSGPNLGSRAWINPFTGFYPRNDSATPNNSHTGHTHVGPSHRILVEINDLNTTLNPGATYYAESQYVTPHEYVWCQANPTQCNMNNNVSYRRYNVTGTASPFSFPTGGFTTQRTKPAILAWTGATSVTINPAPGVDGIGTVAYKVTNPSPGVWHYEYAIFNQNIDRAIQSFSVPAGAGVTLSNIGFKAPPQHPGWSADGTVGNTGYSSTPWTQSQAAGAMTWNSETLAQNPNANAIRWGTMYNFRFDSNQPPVSTNATIGFYKTGAPINVAVQGPSSAVAIKSRADFDGDGKTDLSVFRPSEGNWYLQRSTAGFAVVNLGVASDTIVPGDWDGDGKADAAVFRPNATPGNADFYILNSGNNTVTTREWGTTGDTAQVGDYDGDGKTDAAVFRSSNNTWYISNSGGGSLTTVFGASGDVPVTADYNGDGKTDIAIFRPSSNQWWISNSGGGVTTATFGATSDQPVPADYDGDNKDDIAIYRPASGQWWILNSSTNVATASAFGNSTDIPVPGDYDGDGKDDRAIYRNGQWWLDRSTSGVTVAAFGLSSDIAIPKRYIP